MGTLQGLRAAVYARFSSENQNDRSIEDQVRVCREHVERLSGTLANDLIFADYAVSGASNTRAGFDQVLKLIENRAIDAVVTESGSRLSRDLGDADRLWKLARFQGVRLILVNDGIDSTNEGSRLQFSIKALMNDEYLATLGKETRRGLVGAAKKGQATGGLPYGYTSKPIWKGDREPDGYEIVIHEDQAAVVRRIFSLYRDGHSLATIAETLNKEHVPAPRANSTKRTRPSFWRKTTLRELIRNRAYIGEWSYGKKAWAKDPVTRNRRYKVQPASEVHLDSRPHLQIVSRDLWDGVHARIEVVARKYPGGGGGFARKSNRLFSGLLSCGACGRPMVYSGGSKSVYYRCSGAHSGRCCENRAGVREDTLVEEALREMNRVVNETTLYEKLAERVEARLRTFQTEVDDERGRLDRQLSKVEAEITRMVGFIRMSDAGSGAVEAVTMELNKATQQRRDLQARLSDVATSAAKPTLPSPSEICQLASQVEDRMKQDPVAARELLRRMLENGTLRMTPSPDGSYRAESQLMVLKLPTKAKRPGVTEPSLQCEREMVARGGFEPPTFGL